MAATAHLTLVAPDNESAQCNRRRPDSPGANPTPNIERSRPISATSQSIIQCVTPSWRLRGSRASSLTNVLHGQLTRIAITL
jgi:hypothetical protein